MTDEHGQKVKIPLTYKEALDFIIDQATLAMMEIDDLKQQIEALAIHPENKAERDCLALPEVDLGGRTMNEQLGNVDRLIEIAQEQLREV